MLGRRDDEFPEEGVRDLLGLVRAIYAAEKLKGTGRVRLATITKVGKDLGIALDLAAESKPGTVGHRAAWARARKQRARPGILSTSSPRPSRS